MRQPHQARLAVRDGAPGSDLLTGKFLDLIRIVSDSGALKVNDGFMNEGVAFVGLGREVEQIIHFRRLVPTGQSAERLDKPQGDAWLGLRRRH
jgi:hypothetical protein